MILRRVNTSGWQVYAIRKHGYFTDIIPCVKPTPTEDRRRPPPKPRLERLERRRWRSSNCRLEGVAVKEPSVATGAGTAGAAATATSSVFFPALPLGGSTGFFAAWTLFLGGGPAFLAAETGFFVTRLGSILAATGAAFGAFLLKTNPQSSSNSIFL